MPQKSFSKELTFNHVLPFEKKVKEDGRTIYCGIASSTTLDRDSERMSKSALMKGAGDLKKNSTVFFNHKHDWFGVGKVVDAYVTGEQLCIEWEPSKAKAVEDIITQVEEGILRNLSIGGRVKTDDMEYDSALKKDVRVIKDLELYEVSVVGIGANPDASITSSIHKALDLEKARFAVNDDDEHEEVEGDMGELDEKIPVVPPVLRPAVDGQKVEDEYHGRLLRLVTMAYDYGKEEFGEEEKH